MFEGFSLETIETDDLAVRVRIGGEGPPRAEYVFRPELVVRERFEIETDQVTVALQAAQVRRRRAPRADRADEEHPSRHDQRHQDRHGRVVEQVQVIHEQDEPIVPRPPTDPRPRRPPTGRP